MELVGQEVRSTKNGVGKIKEVLYSSQGIADKLSVDFGGVVKTISIRVACKPNDLRPAIVEGVTDEVKEEINNILYQLAVIDGTINQHKKEKLEATLKTLELPEAVGASIVVPTTKAVFGKNCYIAFHGKNYDEESAGGYVQAPKAQVGGKDCFHWKTLENVKIGDVIFHCANGCVMAVGVATSDFDAEADTDMRKVACEYNPLANPIKFSDFAGEIVEVCKGKKYQPFDKSGKNNMGYLYDMGEDLVRLILEKIKEANGELASYFADLGIDK